MLESVGWKFPESTDQVGLPDLFVEKQVYNKKQLSAHNVHDKIVKSGPSEVRPLTNLRLKPIVRKSYNGNVKLIMNSLT